MTVPSSLFFRLLNNRNQRHPWKVTNNWSILNYYNNLFSIILWYNRSYILIKFFLTTSKPQKKDSTWEQCFSCKIVFQNQSCPWRPFAWVNFFGKGATRYLHAPCITKEQSIGAHDIVNDQGFGMIYRAVSTQSAIWTFSCVRVNTAKQKDGLSSSLMLNVLEAKIFQYGFLEGHNVWENKCCKWIYKMIIYLNYRERCDDMTDHHSYSVFTT